MPWGPFVMLFNNSVIAFAAALVAGAKVSPKNVVKSPNAVFSCAIASALFNYSSPNCSTNFFASAIAVDTNAVFFS